MKKHLLSLFAFLVLYSANAQLVSTLAGSGSSGSLDATGTAASFNFPFAVCTDPSGNVFVADAGNNVIRKITPSGVVSTFAGSGSWGSSNGTGTSASFAGPLGVVSDASGNIYVSDNGNNLIRKITPAGVVTTFAGSGSTGSVNATGTAASFNGPAGLCIDPSGNIYVADETNSLIRKITPGAVVSTYAGSGNAGYANGTGTAASFNNPCSVAYANGNIYVGDTYNAMVRVINGSQVVTDLAGSVGTSSFVNGTGSAAAFNVPRAICADAAGNIYVADEYNNVIRKINVNGVVTTLAGSASGASGATDGNGTSASFNDPNGICFDASSGSLFVADAGNNKIRKIAFPGEALGFDGTDDYISVPTLSTSLANKPFTIEFWAKRVGSNAYSFPIGHGVSPTNNNELLIGFNNINGFSFAFYNNDLNSPVSSAVTDGNWHHWACVYTAIPSTTNRFIYLDGALLASDAASANYQGTGPLLIGQNPIGSNFQGTLDEVRVWTRALCQSEIQNNKNAELSVPQNSLVAYYKFNQGFSLGTNTSVSTATDATGNGNTGTLTNMALTGSVSNWVSPGAVNTGSMAPLFNTPTLAVAFTNTVCTGSTVTLTASGNFTSYTWIGGPTTNTYAISPSITTSYSVSGTNSVGCTSSISVISVSTVASPTISASNGTICSGNSFTISPSGANTFTYQGGNAVVSPSVNTSYTVAGTSTNGCVSVSNATVNLTVNALPVVTVNSGTICTGQSFVISPSGASTYTYQGGSASVSPTTSTNYTVIGTSSLGCVSSAVTSSIVVNITPTISVNSGSICNGQTFTITPSGASTYTYSNGSNTIAPSTNTSINVTGTSSLGCVSSNTAVSIITVNVRPTIAVNSGSICSGNAFTLVPSGASTYTYSSGSNVIAATSNTNINVTGTSSLGCVSSNTAVSSITVNATPTIAVNSGSMCSGGVFTIVPSGASTYTYSNGSNTLSPLSNTNINVTGTSALGCVASNTAVSSITVNATPTISVNSGSICSGSAFTITASGATTYTYSSGSNVVAASSNTTINVTGTSALGCVSSNTAVSSITVNATPTIGVNSGSICSGSVFTIVPTGASTYTYANGSNTLSPSSNTNINVTGTSSLGCVGSNTAVSSITVNARPTISVNSGSICSGNTFTITPSGASTYTYSSGSNVVAATSNTTINVTGTSSLGCISSNTAVSSITVNTTPTVSVNSGSICSGNAFTITPSGASTYTYSSGSNVVAATSNTTINVTGTSSLGCVSSNTAVSSITVNATPTIAVNNGTICSGDVFTIVPTGASTYTYSSGSNTISPNTNTSVNVTGTSSLGCVSSNTAVSSITVNATPTIGVNSGSICAGSVFTIVPTGASTYTYSNGSNTLSPLSNTNINVTGTSSLGCVGSNTAVSSITVNAVPSISVNSGAICSGNIFTIIPTGATTYTISGGSNTVSPNVSTAYSVTGTNSFGCISPVAAISTVIVNALPNVSINASNTLICAGESVTLAAGGASTYVWSNAANTTSIVVTPTITSGTVIYSVTGTSTNNCTNVASVTQSVSACTSIAQLSKNTGIQIYPNPNQGHFVLESENATDVLIMDAIENVVFKQNLNFGKTNIELNNVSKGIYFVKVYNQNILLDTRKIILE